MGTASGAVRVAAANQVRGRILMWFGIDGMGVDARVRVRSAARTGKRNIMRKPAEPTAHGRRGYFLFGSLCQEVCGGNGALRSEGGDARPWDGRKGWEDRAREGGGRKVLGDVAWYLFYKK